MILKYYFNWNYDLPVSDIRYRWKKKIWPIFLVILTIRVRVKGQNSRLDANKGRKRERRNERKRDEKKGFVEAGRAARNETTLDFNGRRTLPLAKFEVPGNSINGYSVCTRLLAAV